MKPASTPRQSLDATLKLLEGHQITQKIALVGIRGYYKNSMGKPAINDRGIYDDAIFLVAPECYLAFNANTDPSTFKPGIASLKTGVWLYKLGIHGLSKPKAQQYKALVQAAKVTVMRDEQGPQTGYFGINIHRGSRTSTSSLGCQTIWPDQWTSFISTVETQLKLHEQKMLPYLLVEA